MTFFLLSKLKSHKDNYYVWGYSRELRDGSEKYNSVDLLEISKPVLPIQWLLYLCFSLLCGYKSVIFQDCYGSGERAWEWSNYNVRKLTGLTEIQPFYLSKHSLDCCELLDNFQDSEKKVILTILPLFSLFLWRSGFSEVFTPPLLFVFNSNFS